MGARPAQCLTRHGEWLPYTCGARPSEANRSTAAVPSVLPSCRCGRFHPLDAFEPHLRSCRQQLARHAARRRERRRLAAAAKAMLSTPAAGAAQQASAGQQEGRQRRPQLADQQQQVQQPAAAAAVVAPAQSAGRVAEMPATERASKRRRAASEASTLSSHEAGAAAALAAALGSGGSSVLQPTAFDSRVPLLAAVPASLPAAMLDPAWALQAAGLPLPAPQPAAPAWLASPVPSVERPPPASAQAQAAEAALLLAALVRDPALASLLSPPQQPTPRQQRDPAALPSEVAEGAALSDEAAGGPQQPSAWEAASRPLPCVAAPQPQLASSPPPTQPQAPGMQGMSTALPLSALMPACGLLPIPAPPAAPGPHKPGFAAVAAGLQQAAAQELISRVRCSQVCAPGLTWAGGLCSRCDSRLRAGSAAGSRCRQFPA